MPETEMPLAEALKIAQLLLEHENGHVVLALYRVYACYRERLLRELGLMDTTSSDPDPRVVAQWNLARSNARAVEAAVHDHWAGVILGTLAQQTQIAEAEAFRPALEHAAGALQSINNIGLALYGLEQHANHACPSMTAEEATMLVRKVSLLWSAAITVAFDAANPVGHALTADPSR